MADHSTTPFNHAGASFEVAMHADAGKATVLVAPDWSDRVWVRFFADTQAPPTARTTTAGWVHSEGTAAELIGVNAMPVLDGEVYYADRKDPVGPWTLYLACDTNSGYAVVRFEKAGNH